MISKIPKSNSIFPIKKIKIKSVRLVCIKICTRFCIKFLFRFFLNQKFFRLIKQIIFFFERIYKIFLSEKCIFSFYYKIKVTKITINS